MARGPSGRTVVDLDPALKRDLHSKLAAHGLSLKEWFIRHAKDFVAGAEQDATAATTYDIKATDPAALVMAEPSVAYKAKPKPGKKTTNE